MVRVKIVVGEFAGAVREFDGVTVRDENTTVNPTEILVALVGHGSVWEVDLSAANDREILDWMRADLVARILRAYGEGRPIIVDGVVFTREDDVGVIEDAIANSGKHCRVGSDDERGLVIVLVQIGPEPLPN